MNGIAKTFFLFSGVNDPSIKVDSVKENNTITAKLFQDETNNVLIINLKEITKGYYTIAYHAIYHAGTGEEVQTSNNESAALPGDLVLGVISLIVNDFFKE